MITLLTLINRLLKCLWLIATRQCDNAAEEAERGYRIGVERLEQYYREERK